MVLGGLLRSGSSAADEAGSAAKGLDFSDSGSPTKVVAYGTGELANQPARIASAGGSAVSGTSKALAAGAVGTSGVYFGSQAYDERQGRLQEEARQASAQEYSQATQAILNNQDLSPDQKQDAIQRLQDMADEALDTPGGGGSILSRIDDLSLLQQAFLGLVVLTLVRAAAKKYSEA